MQLRATALFVLFFAILAFAQGTITTVVGGAPLTFPTTPIAAKDAPLLAVGAVAVDTLGNVYATDLGNNQIVKITPGGTLTAMNYRDGQPSPSNGPYGLAADSAGNLYVLYYHNTGLTGTLYYINKISPSGEVTSLNVNLSLSFPLNGPTGIAADAAGNVYVVESGRNRILKITPGVTVSTVTQGSCAPPDVCHLNRVTLDAQGNLYISEGDPHHRIRKLTPDGIISTVAGIGASGYSGDGGLATQAMLKQPGEMAVDSAGNLHFVDAGNKRIRRVSTAGIITTVAVDSGNFLGDGGPASSAALSSPSGVALDAAGNLYIADYGNSRVRKIDPAGVIITFAGNGNYRASGDGGPATQATLYYPEDVVADRDGNMYVSDRATSRVRKITRDGVITTMVGSTPGFAGDGGPAAAALLRAPYGLALDADGALYIADSGNNRIRKVSQQGIITTVATVGSPTGVAIDLSGNLYITDPLNYAVLKVDAGGTISTAVTLSGSAHLPGARIPTRVAADRDGNLYVAYQGSEVWNRNIGGIVRVSPAGAITILVQGTSVPSGLALDPNGTLYVSEPSRVYRVEPDLTTVTVAGTGTQGFSGDGGLAVRAQLNIPRGIALDAEGSLLIADTNNGRVRRVSFSGCSGAAEPALSLSLPAGFYIAEVRTAAGSRDGNWGLSVNVNKGLIPGGFNLGGAIAENGGPPSYGAFYVPATENVTVRVDAQAMLGGDSSRLSISARLLDANRQPVGSDQSGSTSIQFDRTLSEGFYILEVRTGAGAPRANFQASFLTDAIAGGVNAGGFAASGTVGFGAFYVPEPQNVTLQAFGQNFGQVGAACLQLTLLDANRKVVGVVP